MRLLIWLRCLLRGHRRVRFVSRDDARWETIRINFVRTPGSTVEFHDQMWFHYEPCRDCGQLFLFERGQT